MKPYLLLCCLVVTLAAPASAQWVHQNPIPTSQTLRDVAWVSPSMMLAVGDAANIHRSHDGGASWTMLHGRETGLWGTGLTAPFCAVHALNDTVVIAVNRDGAVVRTTNGGDTWSIVFSQNGLYCYSVTFLDAQYGIVGGGIGKMLYTTDGGRSWSVRSRYASSGSPDGVAMHTPFDWVAVTSDGLIHRTLDSGATWTQSTITPRVPQKSLSAIRFADALRGVAVGSEGAVTTTDGGTTWRYQEDLVTSDMRDVAYTSAGWVAVGRHGFIMRSDDGTSWQRVASGTTQDLVAISFHDGLNGVVLGSSGTVLHTTDGGVSFSVLRDPMLPQLRAVSFSDTLHGIAAGLGGVILHTVNGGATWALRSPAITTDIVTAAWASPTTGIVAGARELLHTTDGGTTWVRRLSVGTSIERVALKGARALAVETRGTLYASDDTGRTWRTVECGGPVALTGASVIDHDAWVVVGPRTMLVTDNAGADWTFKDGFINASMMDVQFINRRTGWILERGSLFRTTNGGVTFEHTIVSSSVTRMHFTDAQRGVLIDRSTVLHTTDGGATWRSTPPLTTGTL
jgi:photosystem II stability/assembly factor-like uncharacterized protein